MKPAPFAQIRLAAAVGVAACACPALAADFDLPDGQLSVKGSAFVGTVVRTGGRNSELIVAPNAALVGAVGAAVGSKNGDDGDLNYKSGDAVSRAIKGTLSLGYRSGDFGLVAGVKAWDDLALKNAAVPFGSNANGYAANTPLSDTGFVRDARFSGADLSSLYAFGRSAVGASTLSWKAGLQTLAWGDRALTTTGGLRDLMPRDFAALARAGSLPEEVALPVPALTATLAATPTTQIDAFWETAFRANVAPGCGTFFSQSDYTSPGCDRVLLGAVNDPTSVAKGQFFGRAPDVRPDNSGEFGLALRQRVESMDAVVGVYAARFDSRSLYLGAIKSTRLVGAPYVAGNADGMNPQYFISYPTDIRMFALSFEKMLQGGIFNAELSYRPNQPFQYNAIDLLNAFASPVAATPLRTMVTALAPGQSFNAYERHKAMQLNLGGAHELPGFFGASSASLNAELTYKHVLDLPDQNVVRFRRSDVFGQAPVAGAACPATSTAKTCSQDGYVSTNALAYRLRLAMKYPQVWTGVDVTTGVLFSSDVRGWSEDGSINEGRQFALLSVKAEIRKAWVAELSWAPTWGGAYNNAKDKSSAAVSVGYRY